MDKDDALKSVDIVDHWLKEVSTHNTLVRDSTKILKASMLTLMVQAEKGDAATKAVIKVIAKEVEKTIKTLNTSTNNLINSGREELHTEFEKISEYIRNN